MFALVIAYFGAAQQGAVGFRSIDLTIASLVSLVIYLIPLIAPHPRLPTPSWANGERNSSTCSSPCRSPAGIILGKYAGLARRWRFHHRRLWRGGADPLAPKLDLNALFHYAGFMVRPSCSALPS